MEMEGPWQAATAPRADYLYNGKELEEELKLNWYAYGFRYYDPSIGRFTGVDPIADQFPWVSVYNYAEDSPISGIDLWGLQYVNFNEALFYVQSQQTWLTTKHFNKKIGNYLQEPNFSGGYDVFGKRYFGRTIPIQVALIRGFEKTNSPLNNYRLSENFRKTREGAGQLYDKGLLPPPGNSSTGLKITGRLGLLITALDLTTTGYNSYKEFFIDLPEEESQLAMIEKAWGHTLDAANAGEIPSQFFNSEDFSKIVDFIYRGTPIENQGLSEIAQGILDTRAMPKDRFFNLGEGGLDNYPSQPQESRVYDPDGNN